MQSCTQVIWVASSLHSVLPQPFPVPPPIKVLYQLHAVQEVSSSGKSDIGAAICKQAEQLDAALVVSGSHFILLVTLLRQTA